YEDISYELHNYYSQSQHRARITQLIKKLSQHLKFALRQMAETSDGVDRVVFNSLADFYGVVFDERLSELKAVLDFPRVQELFEKNPDISEVLQQLRNMAKADIESLGKFFPQELLPRHLATFQDVDTSDSLFVGYDPRSRARAVVLYHLKNLLHNFSQASEDHKLVVGRLDIIHRWSSIHVCYRTENQPENPIELANFDLNVLSKAERESLDEEISRLMRMLESNLQKLAG
ncbi:MAG: hypothetical protein NZO16_02475, partial [Deltaproteobacteria bacterium]|nr:hypothetical protein [Deltaproteobacteria bacterium]